MRKMIAGMQMSLDGFIEGPNGELDWVEAWNDTFDVMSQVDTCVLGGGMYPGYEQYWRAILADPEAVLAFSGKVATAEEVAYARFADRTPHLVLSTTLDEPDWPTARIVRDVETLAALKQEPGKDIFVVGGARTVSSLISHGLVDEIRLTVHPIILGEGKALFQTITGRHRLTLVEARPLGGDRVNLVYKIAGKV